MSTASRQFQAGLSVTGQDAPPPRDPGHGAGHTATFAIVTPGALSTGAGLGLAPHLTGAFAGTGGFTVSPIHGTTSAALRQFQAGLSVTGQGAPPPSSVHHLTGAFAGTGGFTISPVHGTPGTALRQFQPQLSVTGQSASQNAAAFVTTSQIPNAPNIGFTQAGVFHAVTMHNAAAWHGAAGGAVPSAMPTSPPHIVSTVNGTPVATFTLNNPIKMGLRTSFATPAKSPLIGNGWGRIAAPASSFFQGGPIKTTPLYGVTGGSLILNGTGGSLGSRILTPRKP